MLNFVLEKDKKIIIKEYFSRIFIYFLLFVLFSLVLLIFLFLPSNFYSKYKNNTVSQQLLSIKGEVGENSEDPIEIIKDINKLEKVFTEEEKIAFSSIIEKIISLKNKDIKISSFSLSNDTKDTVKIILNGISNNRSGLTLFEKNLKKDGFFQSVDLPVSSLIKNLDSDFIITLIYKK